MTKSALQTKIFIGYEISPDLAFRLSRSKTWKQAISTNLLAEAGLTRQPFNGKKYIGVLMKQKMIPVDMALQKAKKIETIMNNFCPDIDWSKERIKIFSQVFVS